jgi:outer membrane receptor protein involved in Fe transport
VTSVEAKENTVKQGVLEEVIVVAQKRPQNLQDVPVAVTAFSGADLEISGIKDVFDLKDVAPALNVGQAAQSRSTTFSIRGIGTFTNNFGLEPSVGLYVDGVYRSRQGSMINNLVDLESVEVLRGPQGTLFGRNTLAGAVMINTLPPTHEDEDGFVEVTAGNYDLLNFSGAKSVSVIEERLSFRMSGFSSQRDGYIDDLAFGDEKISDKDRWGARIQSLVMPIDALSVRIIADYSKRRETCCALLTAQDNLRPLNPPDGAAPYVGSDVVARSLGGTTFTADQFYDLETELSTLPVSNDEDWGSALIINWNLLTFEFTSITGYRSYEADNVLDNDHSNLLVGISSANEEQESWSQEFRVSSSGETASYVAGLYYFYQELDSVSTTQFLEDANAFASHDFVWYPETNGQFPLEDVPNFPLPAFPLFTPGSAARDSMQQEHKAYAAFGQVDYFLTHELMLTAGLRYTHEDKQLSGKFTQGSAPDFVDNDIAADIVLMNLPAIAPQDPVNESLSDDQVTGTFKLSWFFVDDAMVYASFGTGYKAGGTNTDRIDPRFDYVFDPEKSDSAEIGLKVTFPEQALRVNMALHKTNIDDLQVSFFQGDGFMLQNAGNLETYGGELELNWAPTESLNLTAAYAKTDGDFENYDNGPCWIAYPFHTGRPDPRASTDAGGTQSCNFNGLDLAEPEYFLLSAYQTFDIIDGIGGSLLAEYIYNGKAESSLHDPFHTASSYDLLNLRLGFEVERYGFVITLWGRNVLDEEYGGVGVDAPISPGRVLSIPGEPATYGVTMRMNFR